MLIEPRYDQPLDYMAGVDDPYLSNLTSIKCLSNQSIMPLMAYSLKNPPIVLL